MTLSSHNQLVYLSEELGKDNKVKKMHRFEGNVSFLVPISGLDGCNIPSATEERVTVKGN